MTRRCDCGCGRGAELAVPAERDGRYVRLWYVSEHAPRADRERILRERGFWSRVRRWGAGSDGCWEWDGYRRKGYGRVTFNNRPAQLAHRIAWELTHGPIPDGLFVCHRCDNPPCCNPAHFFLGTIVDNNRDSVTKGRHVVGERNGSARLTREQAAEIKRLRLAGVSQSKRAALFGVGESAVQAIDDGRSWRWVQP